MSLVEILIAVVFLAICASVILDAVWTSNLQAGYALRRSLVMGVLQDKLEVMRGAASAGSLDGLGSTTSVTPPGFANPVTVTVTVNLESNSRVLYDVTATATWTESNSLGTRTDSASLATVVKD